MEAQPKLKEHIQSLLNAKLMDDFFIGKDEIKGVYVDFVSGGLIATNGEKLMPIILFSADEIQNMKMQLENLIGEHFHKSSHKGVN